MGKEWNNYNNLKLYNYEETDYTYVFAHRTHEYGRNTSIRSRHWMANNDGVPLIEEICQ